MENKKAGLSRIPLELQQGIEQNAKITEADLKALQEAILTKGPMIQAALHRERAGLPPQQTTSTAPVQPPVTKQPSYMSYAIEGHVIMVPLDGVSAGIQLFYTLLAFVWGKDKKVAKILKQFDFKFFDANNIQIYPPLKKNVKK